MDETILNMVQLPEFNVELGLHTIRFVGLIWLLFLIGHLHLIGEWLGEDQRTTTIEHMFKEELDYISIYY